MTIARLPTGRWRAARSSTLGSIQPAWSSCDEAAQAAPTHALGERERRAEQPRDDARGGERPLAAPADEQVLVGEQLDRLADGHPAHAEPLAKLRLGRAAGRPAATRAMSRRRYSAISW